MSPGPTYAIAIDGGGSRCRMALVADGQATTVETGSANVSTDLAGTAAQIIRGLNEIADRAGVAAEKLARVPAYAGLAGVTGGAVAARLAEALPFTQIRIEDDRPAALRGALGKADGIVLHCGTGSFAAAQKAGDRRFVGGWGPVLGDEASAQWVGRKALSRALDVVDGLIDATGLSRSLVARFAGPAEIVAFAASASPAEFGEIAVEVTRHAGQGDAIARSILTAAAADLAKTCRALGWAPGTAICLTGGIGPQYAPYLPEDMQADLAAPRGEPLEGAIALAEAYRREVAGERR